MVLPGALGSAALQPASLQSAPRTGRGTRSGWSCLRARERARPSTTPSSSPPRPSARRVQPRASPRARRRFRRAAGLCAPRREGGPRDGRLDGRAPPTENHARGGGGGGAGDLLALDLVRRGAPGGGRVPALLDFPPRPRRPRPRKPPHRRVPPRPSLAAAAPPALPGAAPAVASRGGGCRYLQPQDALFFDAPTAPVVVSHFWS